MNNTKYIVDLIIDTDADYVNDLIRQTLTDAGIEVIAVNANYYYED
jgi:hypothetical protein